MTYHEVGVPPLPDKKEEAVAEKKAIAVVGATGGQGGGLARAILADADGGFAPAADPTLQL